MHEEGELYLLSEELAGLDGEIQIAQTVAFQTRPAAVRPRAHHEFVHRARIIFLDGAVDVERPHRVFRVEPTADVEHRTMHVVHVLPERATFPEVVVRRVVNYLLPVA